MRVDAYTKAVLTVIAACLLWMCFTGSVITSAGAQAPREPQEVVVVGTRAPVPVTTAPRTSLAVRPGPEWYEQALPVQVPRPLPTTVTGIDRSSGGRWDPLDVNVKEQPRKGAPGDHP